ncbi:MAG: putative deoxyribonuclease YcfH [Candidatus Accumulibacter sp. BA-94]|uniref:TatD family hydrolase n=1 Tax=Accumulibacter sp. TaxID=2053492 RepID=UPI0004494F9C|nr:TatD family hydrolase [Accumulibacter sp.]EXI92499.1 MAG: putative deoxyribonuclease YcfH [Candidatus Accumulibacter sp. BA-94]MBL8390513.1 TatD family hydrolase [Accumulibacter sp.]HRD88041.1 TatD family hydrolase [Accumulibacter sp.]
MLVDSHCHLDFPPLADGIEESIALMRANEVGCALCISVTLEGLARVLHLADTWPMLLATVGVHPEETGVREPTVDDLVDLAAHPRVVAIGETGLDYYWHKDSPEWQRERFRTHIRAARAARKPLVIHTREAAADTLRLMVEEGAGEVGGIMHCFTESWSVAEAALDLGFHISLSGIVTFQKALTVRDVALRVPLDRLLIETDSPYLAPVPFRGRTNQPAYVRHVAEEVARLRGLSYQQVADATTANFFNLFPEARTKVAQ